MVGPSASLCPDTALKRCIARATPARAALLCTGRRAMRFPASYYLSPITPAARAICGWLRSLSSPRSSVGPSRRKPIILSPHRADRGIPLDHTRYTPDDRGSPMGKDCARAFDAGSCAPHPTVADPGGPILAQPMIPDQHISMRTPLRLFAIRVSAHSSWHDRFRKCVIEPSDTGGQRR